MKFLLDENVETRVLVFLSDRGHDAKRISRNYPQALPDAEVLDLARREQRILITSDRDFGELIYREQRPHSGVIYFRLPLDVTVAQKIAWLEQILASHQAQLGQFLVVTPGGIRVGRLV
jgi:predicted nuclease of predicted toxin-antitoxin system